MNQIFISHSQKDESSIGFFNKLFSSSNLKAIYEEIEQLKGFKINSDKITEDIRNSVAVFLLYDNLIENLDHTKDWITWESGTANGLNKQIWVFEKFNQVRENKIVIPKLNNLVVYDPSNSDWLNYISEILKRYENLSNFVTPAIASGIGAAIYEDKVVGGIIGGIIGLGIDAYAQSKQNHNSIGLEFCCPKCFGNYRIHIPRNYEFRCPICNEMYLMN